MYKWDEIVWNAVVYKFVDEAWDIYFIKCLAHIKEESPRALSVGKALCYILCD